MKILVTGAEGFVGKNLIATLEGIRDGKDIVHQISDLQDPSKLIIYKYDKKNAEKELEAYCTDCDFVFHLAGVNRPENNEEFMEGNFGFSSTLLKTLKNQQNKCPVMLSSSLQASQMGRYADSAYGESKRAGEELFFSYHEETGAKVLVYRLPNLFGKLCRPNYNSVIATFCHNVANDLPILVTDPMLEINIVYIDDLIEELLRAINGVETSEGNYCYIPIHYETTLGFLADTITGFPLLRDEFAVPDMSDSLVKKLYSTWLSYLPSSSFIYDLKMNIDARGSFTEIIKTQDCGQFSVNISEPGIIKGNHWHHSKNEKFIVVKGKGLIQMRKIGRDDKGQFHPVIEFYVSSKKIQVVDIIPGYTHNIINLSDSEELVTFMWANEIFNPNAPDTFFEVV